MCLSEAADVTVLDSIVVGAGQAGLGVSYYLQKAGRLHVVFERGRIGESWLSQRWDSFRLNTINSMNVLPGLPYEGAEPDGFWGADELARYFREYAEHFKLPVQEGVSVLSVERAHDKGQFIVRTRRNDGPEESNLSRSIVIASGVQRSPKIPSSRAQIPKDITQLHTAEYRNAAALPPGAVVVVGSGQSGCQICEDLLSAGRVVYLCTSKVGRVPRRYRGRDVLEWWLDMKFLDVKLESLEDESISRAAQPQISGLGRHGHTVSLQYLRRQGAVILGRLHEADREALTLGDEAAENVRHADEFSQKAKDAIDAYLKKAGIPPPALEADPADLPDPGAECVSPLRRLDLRAAGIGTVIWASGFTADLSWIRLPVLDAEGKPIHTNGISPVPGVYFIGFPWLRSRKSGIIYGIEEDAREIAAAIAQQVH